MSNSNSNLPRKGLRNNNVAAGNTLTPAPPLMPKIDRGLRRTADAMAEKRAAITNSGASSQTDRKPEAGNVAPGAFAASPGLGPSQPTENDQEGLQQFEENTLTQQERQEQPEQIREEEEVTDADEADPRTQMQAGLNAELVTSHIELVEATPLASVAPVVAEPMSQNNESGANSPEDGLSEDDSQKRRRCTIITLVLALMAAIAVVVALVVIRPAQASEGDLEEQALEGTLVATTGESSEQHTKKASNMPSMLPSTLPTTSPEPTINPSASGPILATRPTGRHWVSCCTKTPCRDSMTRAHISPTWRSSMPI